MIDFWNRVNTNIKTVLADRCSNFTATKEDTPPGFPCTCIEQTDNGEVAKDMENTENAVRSVIEIRTISNKSLTEARTVMGAAADGMRQMGYSREYGPTPIDNASDKSLKVMFGRFSRVIGLGEEIKKLS